MSNQDFVTINVKNEYISKATKNVILMLPGFENHDPRQYSVKQLRTEMNDYMRQHNAYKKGLRIDDYYKLYVYNHPPQAPQNLNPLKRYVDTDEYKSRQQKKKDKELFKKGKPSKKYADTDDIRMKRKSNNRDDDLFNNIIPSFKRKTERKQFIDKQKLHHEFKIGDEIELLKIPYDKLNKLNKEYRARMKEIKNRKQFTEYLTKYIDLANKQIGFDIVIGDDETKRYAFNETLRYIDNNCKDDSNCKVWIKCIGIDGERRYFPLNDAMNPSKISIEQFIAHIAGEIELEMPESDVGEFIVEAFIPVKYEIIFEKKEKRAKRKRNQKVVRYYHEKLNDNTGDVEVIEDEIDEDFRELIEGSFFKYINLSGIDLTRYQIYDKIDSNNYNDNCFVYAVLQSGVFTELEMNELRRIVRK